MEYGKQPQTPADAPVNLSATSKNRGSSATNRLLDHAPVRIYEKPPKQQASPFPPAFQ